MNQEIKEICHAIADKKGVLIKVLNVRDLTSIADYFILASTRNKKQSQAAADAVEDKMAEKKVHCLRKEGYREGDWILLDFDELDSLWSEAPAEEYHEEDDEADGFEGMLKVKR